jgi:mono/diheme cytochrome c family protein
VHTHPPPRRSRTALRLLARTAGVLTLIALTAAGLVYLQSERRLQRDYGIRVQLPVPDRSLIAEGAELALTRGCADCHGADFSGKILSDDALFGRLVGDNLTRMPERHADRTVHERMYLALHHGVDLDGRPLMMMPSKEFASLSAREMEALSAYFSSVAPRQRALPESRLGPLGRMLLAIGKLDGFLSAEVINHDLPVVAEPPPKGTLAYGRYVAQLCTGCHQPDFGGGRMSHGGPSAPPAANLTPHATGLAPWSEEDFVRALRHGQRPDGSRIDEKFMPWKTFGRANDAELRAVWRYLRSLPPVDRHPGAEAP